MAVVELDIGAIKEKALGEYRQKKGEFVHPFDWRHHSHDICPSLEMPVPTPAETSGETCHQTYSTKRLDSIQGEMRHLRNKLNEHIDRSRKKKSGYYD
jgi:hypothetical protein